MAEIETASAAEEATGSTGEMASAEEEAAEVAQDAIEAHLHQ